MIAAWTNGDVPVRAVPVASHTETVPILERLGLLAP